MNLPKIEVNGEVITVQSIYNSEFVKHAKNLGGAYTGGVWSFDARNETLVRSACLRCLGHDGFITDLVDVEITIPKYAKGMGACKPIEVFGRTLARAFGRDSGAKLGEGVVLLKGGFSSGGSVKNWCTDVKENTRVIVRDVSGALVREHDDDAFILQLVEAKNPMFEYLSELEDAIRDSAELHSVALRNVKVVKIDETAPLLIDFDTEKGRFTFQLKGGVLVQYRDGKIFSALFNEDNFTSDPVGISAYRLLYDAEVLTSDRPKETEF